MSGEKGTMATTVRFLQEENQRLHERCEELGEELSYVRDCLKSIRGLQRAVEDLDVEEELLRLLNRIVYEAVRIVDAVEGSLCLIDEETHELVFVVVRGVLQEKLQGYRMPLNQGIAGWVTTHREPVIANDILQDERFSAAIDKLFKFRTRSLICVPLISRNRIVGVIEVVNSFSGGPFDERDMDMLSMLAPIAATAIDLAGIQARA